MKSLSFLDQYLTFWIIAAMILGVLFGYFIPSTSSTIDSWDEDGVNWPIALGLIIMMYPPFARVKYDRIWKLMKGTEFDELEKDDAKEVGGHEDGIEIISVLAPRELRGENEEQPQQQQKEEQRREPLTLFYHRMKRLKTLNIQQKN